MNKRKIIIIAIVTIILFVGFAFIYLNLPSIKQKKSETAAIKALDIIQDPLSFSESELKNLFSEDLANQLNSAETKKTQQELKENLGYSSVIEINNVVLEKKENNLYFLKITATRTETYTKYGETHTNGAIFFATIEEKDGKFIVISLIEEDDVTQDSL